MLREKMRLPARVPPSQCRSLFRRDCLSSLGTRQNKAWMSKYNKGWMSNFPSSTSCSISTASLVTVERPCRRGKAEENAGARLAQLSVRRPRTGMLKDDRHTPTDTSKDWGISSGPPREIGATVAVCLLEGSQPRSARDDKWRGNTSTPESGL